MTYALLAISVLALLAYFVLYENDAPTDTPTDSTEPGPDAENPSLRSAGRTSGKTEEAAERTGASEKTIELTVRLEDLRGNLVAGDVLATFADHSIRGSSGTGSIVLEVPLSVSTSWVLRGNSADGLWSTAPNPVILDVQPRAKVTLKLVNRRIRGRVLGKPEGMPIAGATISWGTSLADKQSGESTRSDGDGMFELMLEYEAYTAVESGAVLATHPHWRPVRASLSATQAELELHMASRPRLKGRVRLSDGAEASGTLVRVQIVWRGMTDPPLRERVDPWIARRSWVAMASKKTGEQVVRMDIEVLVQADGTFETPLPFEGAASVVVEKDGYQVGQSEGLEATSGLTTVPEIVLDPTGKQASRLRIVDADGKGMRGINVWFQDPVKGAERRTLGTSKSDEQGYVDTSAFPLGTKLSVVVSDDKRDESADRLPRGAQRFYDWVVGDSGDLQIR